MRPMMASQNTDVVAESWRASASSDSLTVFAESMAYRWLEARCRESASVAKCSTSENTHTTGQSKTGQTPPSIFLP